MNDAFHFENPWRKTYEWHMTIGWLSAAALSLAMAYALPIFVKYNIAIALICAAIGLYRASQAWMRSLDRSRIRLAESWFISIEKLLKIANKACHKNAFWLGKGFQWTDVVAGRMHALFNQGIVAQMGKAINHKNGAYWLHGLACENAIHADLTDLVGHTLIVGTTRVGKTRMMDLLITQAIVRNEPVIIIDPKGDKGLAENTRKVCEAIGESERYVYFNPAHVEKSVCIDPLRNWNRKTELASRIAALIPSETGADPFTAFGWKVVNDIVSGMIASGQRPNLVQLRRYVESGPDELVIKALREHFKRYIPNWETGIAQHIKKYRGNQVLGHISFYKDVVTHEAQSVELSGLISTYEHNREHFQKMVASLIPVLSMLTSDQLADLLSPDFEPGDNRVVMDTARAIRMNKVLYVGLDSLSDSTVGSAIGSVLLADLTAVAGDRYNYGIDSIKPVNLFIDEAAEVINQPTIQLMNKGGGALFRVTIATQTFADFAARMGDENKARQVLANTNNKIALRVLDSETQKYFADGIPRIKSRDLLMTYNQEVESDLQEFSAGYREQQTLEEADLIPPALLSELPPLHYFARLSGGMTVKGRIPILK
ncbi:MAG: conjugative transfer system coupling protein TraD [Nitrosomonas sp.]|uniref:Conjugal transfer pilus assembly protein TraD n=1 Tax=Nitrosomonas aestuarii TaxID=52441 RepID=A0A1I4DD79_9PROT|nr:conjugative transfer system coupling protein TraD [Nitrosomonas aestuarii]MBX3630325.1 conjugative transfer system coupling protein TraD [Nitrosomonas sp.]SFK91774.1 conjugal transfer pilus assembly protein TraD [Nitrosomonas aestuarii]